MKSLCVGLCTAISLLALPACMAQSNPWNGSWKLDPSSLKYEGATFSVATDDDGFTDVAQSDRAEQLETSIGHTALKKISTLKGRR